MGILEKLMGRDTVARVDFEKFMTDTELEEARDVVSICNRTVTDVISRLYQLNEMDEAYNGEQPTEDDRPNSRINLVHPNVEGQVADISLQTLGFLFKGQEEMDTKFADDARIMTEWTFEHQENINRIKATFLRRLLKYGFAYFKANYNPFAFNEYGLATIETPCIDRVFIDQKITNPSQLQNAEYIFEYIDGSRQMAINVYGKEKADAITYGESSKKDDLVFDTDDFRNDSETYFMLIQFWTKEEGILRCREYTDNGMLLFDSFKGTNRKENQKNKPLVKKPLYTKVYNKYPYFMENCYEKEGELYGFGDVKLIADIQNTINNLYDNIRVSTRARRLLIDGRSNIDPDDINDEGFDPIVYDGSQLEGAKPVNEVEMGTPSPEWWRMLDDLKYNIQKITRYSEMMTGQGNAGRTATESAILQQQGSKATSMKLSIFSNALKDVAMYCLGLDLQYKDGVKFLRISESSDEMRPVNISALKNIPISMPMEQGEREKWRNEGYADSSIPKTQLLEKDGKPVTRDIALDLKVSIGNKMPNSPAMFGQLVTQFATLQLISEDGQPRPAIMWEEFRKVLTDVYDLPLETAEKVKEDLREMEAKREMERQQMMQQQQAEAQAKQGLASPLPNGSPANMPSENNRSSMNIMQGNQDFQNLQ